MTRRLLGKAARAVLEAARLVKAPDWSETRGWQVVSGSRVLVHITPAYRAGRRAGWQWRLADTGLAGGRTEPTTEKAAVAGLDAWQRWTTNKEVT